MKYAITGHTDGIGKRLSELLPNFIGYSRSNGFDITLDKDRKRIVENANECDVFINNASNGFGQSLLFIDLLKKWKDNPAKTIINVGSRIAEISLPLERFDLLEYQLYKLSLKEITTKATNAKCKIHYRWFAYVGTEKILKKYPHFTSADYISIDEACSIILS